MCAQLCVQLGGGDESEEGFKILRPVLSAIMIDGCASVAARQSVSVTIGLHHSPVVNCSSPLKVHVFL